MDLLLIGFDRQTGLGGPIEVTEGRGEIGLGEMIVDSSLTDRYGLDIGDSVRAGGADWLVVGRSEGGDFVGTHTVFVNHGSAQESLGMSDSTTFYVLEIADGADEDEAIREIEERAPQVVAYTRDEFAANTRERVLGDVIPLLVVVLALAFVVGLAVTGLTVYTSVLQKARDFGVLKAVGFENSYLYRLVVEQSLITSVFGFLLGTAVALLLSPLVHERVPQFVVLFRWQDVVAVLAATTAMAMIAAIIPVRRIAGIDPVSVFSG
jgi:putative ABC transport system permease protein